MKRKAISKKLRFEVFKRDAFKCQYCGRGAPDVLLHIDHIQPVAEGGGIELINLITACADCNLGKGARLLTDNTTVEKQRTQLAALNERRLQMKMMLDWRNGLANLDEEQIEAALDQWKKYAAPYRLTDTGLTGLRAMLKKYGLAKVLDAIDESAKYLKRGTDDALTAESVDAAWKGVGKILNVNAQLDKKPYLKELFYIRGIVRNRYSYCDDRLCLKLLEDAHIAGATIESLKKCAIENRNWSQFRTAMETFIDARNGGK